MLWALDPTVNAVNKWSQWPQSHPQQQWKTLNPQNQHACGNCTKSHAPGWAFYPAKDCTCSSCGRIGHWDVRCQITSSRQKDPNKSHPDVDPKVENKSIPHCWYRQWLWLPRQWSLCCHHRCSPTSFCLTRLGVWRWQYQAQCTVTLSGPKCPLSDNSTPYQHALPSP